jgi:hypothetical protein
MPYEAAYFLWKSIGEVLTEAKGITKSLFYLPFHAARQNAVVI